MYALFVLCLRPCLVPAYAGHCFQSVFFRDNDKDDDDDEKISRTVYDCNSSIDNRKLFRMQF